MWTMIALLLAVATVAIWMHIQSQETFLTDEQDRCHPEDLRIFGRGAIVRQEHGTASYRPRSRDGRMIPDRRFRGAFCRRPDGTRQHSAKLAGRRRHESWIWE